MTFNPNEHTIQLKSKNGEQEYLPVQWRLVWINDKCKAFKITILHRIIDLDREVTKDKPQWDAALKRTIEKPKTAKGFAYFEVRAEDEEGRVGEDVGSETAVDFDDFIEKAKTKATGRALALIGFGTQHAAEFNEMPRIVDAPVDQQPAAVATVTTDAPSDPPPSSTPPSPPPKAKALAPAPVTEKKETAAPVPKVTPASASASAPAPAPKSKAAPTVLPANADLIAETQAWLEMTGPYERTKIFQLAGITQTTNPHLWSTEQCQTVVTWFESEEHENWGKRLRSQAQHDEVMAWAGKDKFGSDAVQALKATITGVKSPGPDGKERIKKLSELSAVEADDLIDLLRNGELNAEGKIVPKTETITIPDTDANKPAA